MLLRTLRDFGFRIVGVLRSSNRPRAARSSMRRFRPDVEVLDQIIAPAAVWWDGGAGNVLASNALNWSNDQVPTQVDDVTIGNVAAHYVTWDLVNSTVASLNLVNVNFEVTGSLQAGNPNVPRPSVFELPGDSILRGPGSFAIKGVANMVGGTMQGPGVTTIEAAATLE